MSIRITGFELLNLNTESSIEKDWKIFTEYYSIKYDTLPLLYQAYKTFDIGRGKFKEHKLFHEGFGFNVDFLELKYFGNFSDYLGLYDFVSLTESIESMQNAFVEEDNIHTMNVAYLGDCIDNMALMVGIGNENQDKLYIECSELFPTGERLILIDDNIFDFIKKLALVENEDIRLGISGYEKLYRNWKEDFWRIKNEQSK